MMFICFTHLPEQKEGEVAQGQDLWTSLTQRLEDVVLAPGTNAAMKW